MALGLVSNIGPVNGYVFASAVKYPNIYVGINHEVGGATEWHLSKYNISTGIPQAVATSATLPYGPFALCIDGENIYASVGALNRMYKYTTALTQVSTWATLGGGGVGMVKHGGHLHAIADRSGMTTASIEAFTTALTLVATATMDKDDELWDIDVSQDHLVISSSPPPRLIVYSYISGNYSKILSYTCAGIPYDIATKGEYIYTSTPAVYHYDKAGAAITLVASGSVSTYTTTMNGYGACVSGNKLYIAETHDLFIGVPGRIEVFNCSDLSLDQTYVFQQQDCRWMSNEESSGILVSGNYRPMTALAANAGSVFSDKYCNVSISVNMTV